jgi:hypothetical protein
MGFLDKTLRTEKLDMLSFLECVEWLRERSEHISYLKGSSDTYWEAKEIIQYLIKRYCKEFGLTSDSYHSTEVGRSLSSTEDRLSDYTKYADTDQAKAEVIAVFKSDIEEDTRRLIYQIKNP